MYSVFIDFFEGSTDVRNMFRGISSFLIVIFLAGAPDLGRAFGKSETTTAGPSRFASLDSGSTQNDPAISAIDQGSDETTQSACHHPCSSGSCQTHCHVGHCLYLVSAIQIRVLDPLQTGKIFVTTASLSSVYLPSDTRPPLA